jgi:hypothetical protein
VGGIRGGSAQHCRAQRCDYKQLSCDSHSSASWVSVTSKKIRSQVNTQRLKV